MTTLLYFQNLASITGKSWRLSNRMNVPNNISPARWTEIFNQYYGYEDKYLYIAA